MAKKKADTRASATEPATRQVVKRSPRTTSPTTTAATGTSAPTKAAGTGSRAKAPATAAPKKARRPPSGPKAPAAPEPVYEEIARVAYEIHLERGGQHGFHFEDWLEAERRLRSGR